MCSFALPRSEKKSVDKRSVDSRGRSRKDAIKGLKIHVQVHNLSANEVSIEELLSWVRSARVFKKKAGKNKSQDIRNIINQKVN